MLKALYIMQQSSDMNNTMQFSVGLVVICLILLIMLWLPDILKG
jgi:hypothetical protein